MRRTSAGWRVCCFGAVVLLLGLGAGAVTSSGAERPPNVLVILADDLGYGDVGFHGCKDIPTPNLDALARSGIRCTNGYASHPFCSPTRAGFLTGRYQQRFGHENNPAFDPDDPQLGLPLDQVTLADVLRKAGYATGLVGKWHLGQAEPFYPNRRGFTEYFGFLGGNHDYFKSFRGQDPHTAILRNGEPLREIGYLTDTLSQEAAAFIERHRAEPFFLYLAYNAVHTPLQAPAKYLDRFAKIEDDKRRTYAAMLSAMDDGIGLVLEKLRDLNLDREMLVFFFSDNGGPPDANGSRNTPLRGSKGQMCEGGIHVPFVIRWTGHLPDGVTYDQPVSSLDIFATAVAAAKAKLPEGRQLDSVNLLPYLTGENKPPPHDVLFWRADGGTRWAVRQGRYKLVNPGNGSRELYDLQADLSETTNIADQHRDLVDKMYAAYRGWDAELMPPRWPNPPRPANRQKKAKN